MCKVCKRFEGWTEGDAFGAELTLHPFAFLNSEGLAEIFTQMDDPERLLYDWPKGYEASVVASSVFQQGPAFDESKRPPSEINVGTEDHGHIIAFDSKTGLFLPAVPITWHKGILVEDAYSWLQEHDR
jgi:hypothetical protein